MSLFGNKYPKNIQAAQKVPMSSPDPGWMGQGVAMDGALAGRIAARARRFGSLSWSEFMDAALYDPDDGFYQAGGQAGRGGDFVTSPELGPLFATVVAHALDRCWEEVGRPDPFVVVEAAAGVGTLARDVLAARPACSPALRYVLVERSATLRGAQAERLALENPALVLGPIAPGEDPDDDEARVVPGTGPLVTALVELPAVGITGVVLANELLDNLAFDLLEWRHDRWHEVRVAAADSRPLERAAADSGPLERAAADSGPLERAGASGGLTGASAGAAGRLVELVVPAPPDLATRADRLTTGASPLSDGARIPIQTGAGEWVAQALAMVEAGRVIVIDYADTTDALARTPHARWLRTFRQHQVALSPLEVPGSQDITCVVAWDQLPAPQLNGSQAEWLDEHGLAPLVQAARQTWRERAAIGDLPAMVARSRVREAEALTDPQGLGGHRVLQWQIGRRA